MANPIAPEGPAGDSAQQPTAPSVIPKNVPSPIDEAAELVGTTEPLAEATTVAAPAPETELNQTTGESLETAQARIDAMQEDVNTLQVIRDDPVAAQLLNDHFAAKARGELPSATGDAPADVEGADPRIDQLFESVNGLTRMFQQDRAERALSQFKTDNPIVADPKVASKMQAILRQPGQESLTLSNCLTIALSELGMSRKPGGQAPLQASETAGAAITDSSDDGDAVQQNIDSQQSFEQGLDAALKSTAKEQGFTL